jgi:DNA-binding MarR family transcriptional regulator
MSLERPATVDDLLNYKLARLQALTSVQGIRLLEGRFGISRREWGLLGLIASYGPVSPSELSARSGLAQSRVSLSISKLVSKGLVLRQALPNDRRRAQVGLSPDGLELYEAAFPQVAALNQRLVEALTPEQIISLSEIMRTLGAAAERLNASDPVPEKADRRRGGRSPR